MNVVEVISDHPKFTKKQVTLRGFLVACRDLTYIAPNEDKYEELDESILISQPGFIDSLYKSAPPWGGGKYTYFDPIEITGIIDTSAKEPFKLEISSISSAFVGQNEAIYTINLLDSESLD
jgi:hypothetical protein